MSKVTVYDRIWLVEKWVDVPGGHSLSQIVFTNKPEADALEGWSITEYVQVPELRCTCSCNSSQGIYHDGDCPIYKAAISG